MKKTSNFIKEKAEKIWEIENNKNYSEQQKMENIAKIIKFCPEFTLYKIDEYIINHYNTET